MGEIDSAYGFIVLKNISGQILARDGLHSGSECVGFKLGMRKSFAVIDNANFMSKVCGSLFSLLGVFKQTLFYSTKFFLVEFLINYWVVGILAVVVCL